MRLRLRDGRTISIIHFRGEATYEWLLEGVPEPIEDLLEMIQRGSDSSVATF